MKERGISFNGEMVRAILDGSKAQTRRIFKEISFTAEGYICCPYGVVGDRLRVREAPKIILEITGVRVERLNSISQEDAISEGLTASCGWDKGFERTSATEKFRALWKSIYGEENWDANPFVWVIEFKRPGDDK